MFHQHNQLHEMYLHLPQTYNKAKFFKFVYLFLGAPLGAARLVGPPGCCDTDGNQCSEQSQHWKEHRHLSIHPATGIGKVIAECPILKLLILQYRFKIHK